MSAPAIAAARHFHDLVLTGPPPSLAELARALDGLVVAVQDADEFVPPTDVPDPPLHDVDALTQLIQMRFPDFGFYGVSDPMTLPAEGLTGDAIDDLLDIACDLADALWRFEHNGLADALWDLKFAYTTHWGRHARQLALYLHARQFR